MRAHDSICLRLKKLSSIVLIVVALGISACHESPRLVKIGLVAPFEGRYRSIGYEVIPAVRLAIREFAQKNATKVSVELVAYDDSGEPDRAILQAQKLAADPLVHAVIGHWRDDTTQAALDIYGEAGITVITNTPMDTSLYPNVVNQSPTIQALETAAANWGAQLDIDRISVPESSTDIVEESSRFDAIKAEDESISLLGGPDWGLLQFEALTSSSVDDVYFITSAAFPEDSSEEFWSTGRIDSFYAGFEAGAAGISPGIYSASAYEATWLALKMVTADTPEVNYLLEFNIDLDSAGRRLDAPVYLYQWQDGDRALIDVLP